MVRLFGLGETIDGTTRDAVAIEHLLGVAPNGRRHSISDAGPWLAGPVEHLFGAANSTRPGHTWSRSVTGRGSGEWLPLARR